MVSAEGLTKCFGSFTAIEDVSFSVAPGEIVGFLGPNGAGKTTTMRILAGVFPPTRGRATVAGHDVVRNPLKARSVVGYFPERVSLYLNMTVAHYLTYVAQMKGLDRRSCRRDLPAALQSCAVEHVAERVIGSLSKGYRQRVGIAQALLGNPHVLILDEPTAGLDPEQVADMRALIRGFRGDRTVILSTHVLSEVEATCDRVIIIDKGRTVAVDSAANLSRRLRPVSQIYVDINGPQGDVLALLRTIPGVTSVEPQDAREDGAAAFIIAAGRDTDLREAVAQAVVHAGWGLRELRPVSLSMEEIFLSLVATHGSDAGNRP